MTPEEKLLALIQQGKQQPEAAASSGSKAQPAETAPAVSGAAAIPAAVAGVAPAAPADPQPLPEKKLKLAAVTAPAPAAMLPPQTLSEPVPAEVKVQATVEAKPAGVATAVEVTADREEEPAASVSVPAGGLQTGSPRSSVRPFSRAGALVFANRMLAAVVLVLMVGVLYSVASIRAEVVSRSKQLEEGSGVQPLLPTVVTRENPPPLDGLLDKISARDVFLPTGMEGSTSAVAVVQGKVADLKLVGVSMDASAQDESMAIIRNKADSKTYFLKKGQLVGETGYTLDRIYDDRVILKMRKQEIEVR